MPIANLWLHVRCYDMDEKRKNPGGQESRGKGGKERANIPSSKTRQPDGQTGTELDEGSVERNVLFQAVGDEDGNHEAVDTDDTGHDNGHDIYILSGLARAVRASDDMSFEG